MKYPLAMELKDSGFPEGSDETGYYVEGVYVPTLEELIEACGEGFSEWRRNYIGVPFGAPGKWLACHSPDRGETDDCVVGDSATEAVARLWLVLNKPNTTSEASS